MKKALSPKQARATKSILASRRRRVTSIEFTQRQHTYASSWRSGTVYTPEFVLNGREWQWSGADTLARQSSETPGVLTVLQNGVGDNFVVMFNSTKPLTGQAIAHVALIGFGVTSDVAHGENAGRKLTHDFVRARTPRGSTAGFTVAWRTQVG